MGATTLGALVGSAIDGMSGDDGVADGAIIGAVTANVLKIVLPIAITYAVGWAVLRGAGELKDRVLEKCNDRTYHRRAGRARSQPS